MILQPNITLDEQVCELIKQNTLSIVDRIKLTLANFVAELYPSNEVYINANQQGANPPCFFVDLFEVSKRKMLGESAKYEVGFTISYIPSNPLSDTELHNVIFKMQQHITDITDYQIYNVNSDITDQIANITGTITVLEANIKEDPIIIKASKELIQ